MRIKIGIATPTPTTMGKSHRVIPISESINTTCHPWKQMDGFYDVNSLQRGKPNSFELIQFLQIAKNYYQLSDDEALGLLQFFRNKTSEAITHLYNDGSRSKMHLEIDRPWRLQTKSICELPGTRQFENIKVIKYCKKNYFINPNTHLTVLPYEALVEKFAGRYLRVQRTYYDDLNLMVACALDDNYAPFEIASLMMPGADKRDMDRCNKLIDQLERHMAPLILSSRS
ncbi:hypothetical protein ACLKA7_002855 [Drosophila subpalustris]